VPNAGDVVRASDRDEPVRALLRQTSAQAVTTATFTSITMDVEDLDDDGGHSTSSNTSRYTAVRAGWFLVTFLGAFVTDAASIKAFRLAVNGTALPASQVSNTAGAVVSATGCITRLVSLGVADYVEGQAFHNKGSNLNTSVATEAASQLTVVYQGA
jgi:hypothetical protein